MADRIIHPNQLSTATSAILIINSLIVLAYFIVAYLWHKKKIFKQTEVALNKEPENNNHIPPKTNETPSENPGADQNLIPSDIIITEDSESSNSNFESFVILKKLGSGSTSDVFLADYIHNNNIKQVAVKRLKQPLNINGILNEIKFLNACRHKNIVTFIKWIEAEDGPCIITEYMSGGDLHEYLLNPDNLLTISTIFSYISQVLDAMVYLSHNHILHRDLAARNCLLNETYEILKINDFGLSRAMNKNYEYISEANQALPLKWLPLEAWEPNSDNFIIFTKKVDIWSFGILIWEMFERGKEFYDGFSLADLYKFLKTNHRLEQPRNCPDELYFIMLSCWDENHVKRPTFDELQESINNLYQEYKTRRNNILSISIQAEYGNGYERPRQLY